MALPTAWRWLLSPPALFVLGLAIGSFLNVVVHRKPRILERGWLADVAEYLQDRAALGRVLADASPARLDELAAAGATIGADVQALPPLTLSRPASRCPACATPIRWRDNVPVVSWLALRARCAACGARIPARYPLVELLTGACFAAIAWVHGPTATTAVMCVAAALLVAAAFIDLDTTLLPDELTLPLIGLGLAAAWLRWTPTTLADAALGALFGYFSLWALSAAYRLVRGRMGMAEGDFKLLAGLGALLGWQALASIVLISSALGAAVGVALIALRGHDRSVPIPFGPYLALAGLASMLAGPRLNAMWSGLLPV